MVSFRGCLIWTGEGIIQALGVAERMAAYVDGLEVDGRGQTIVI